MTISKEEKLARFRISKSKKDLREAILDWGGNYTNLAPKKKWCRIERYLSKTVKAATYLGRILEYEVHIPELPAH